LALRGRFFGGSRLRAGFGMGWMNALPRADYLR
jgi:hypothetical protein